MDRLIAPESFSGSRRSTYLNTASVALVYSGAEAAAIEWQRDLAQSGTLHFDDAVEEAVFEALHDQAARLLNAQPEGIAVGSSATELLASLAWAVFPGAGTNVVGTDATFPSTLYPWSRVAKQTGCEIRLATGTDGYVPVERLIRLVDDRTAVVCVSHVEYRTGQRFDLGTLADVAHRHDALLIVDATQSAGVVPIDVAESGVDALVASGYKLLCGPFGVAILYLAPHLRESLDPGIVGFRSHRAMWDLRPDRLEYPDTARRFEFSTMAYGCALALARSIEFLLGIGVDRIFEYDMALADRLVRGLRDQGAELVSPEGSESPIVAARFPGQDAAALKAGLRASRVVVSCRGTLVRFSPHLYNEVADIDRALEEIQRNSGLSAGS